MKIYKYPYSEGHTKNETDKCIYDAVTKYMAENALQPMGNMFVRRTSLGKPFIEGTPGLNISVTHAGSILLVAVSKNVIGIDCEETAKKVRDAKAFSRRFFTLSEKGYFDSVPEEDKPRVFLEIWTKKEALIKLTGEGLAAISKTDSTHLPPNTELKVLGDYPGYVVSVAEAGNK